MGKVYFYFIVTIVWSCTQHEDVIEHNYSIFFERKTQAYE